jgi:hypothetical protein
MIDGIGIELFSCVTSQFNQITVSNNFYGKREYKKADTREGVAMGRGLSERAVTPFDLKLFQRI